MKKILKMILICFLCIVIIGFFYLFGVLVYASISQFNPDEKEIIELGTIENIPLNVKDTFSILTWNIGYAGLGKEMDFFYEGGKRVRPKKEWNYSYLNGITKFVAQNDTLDFFLFQEVDRDSRRSFYEDQFERMQEKLQNHMGSYAGNYHVNFVPVPLDKPMGKVKGGMATFSKTNPIKATRLATPGSYPWPSRLFMLKRCVIKTVFPTNAGKSLILYNVHNSAFNDATELRTQEMNFMKSEMLAEYQNGNYVIAGGDWNQNPPGLDLTSIKKYVTRENWPIQAELFPKSWKWVYDPEMPTNRDVDKPFNPSETPSTIIDFFLISPNLKNLDVKTVDRQFFFSDHMPVIMTFTLN